MNVWWGKSIHGLMAWNLEDFVSDLRLCFEGPREHVFGSILVFSLQN